MSEYVLFTLAASLTTLPVILYHFGRLSLVSLVANPAILPAQPPLMVLGGASLLLGSLFEPLGRIAAAMTLPFAVYTVRAAELFASIPGSALPVGKVSLGWVLLFYGLLFGLTFFGGRIKGWLARRDGGRPLTATALPAVALAGLGIAAVLVWRGFLSAPDGRLHLTVLDVGSGDALLVQTPDRALLAHRWRSQRQPALRRPGQAPAVREAEIWIGWWWRPPATSRPAPWRMLSGATRRRRCCGPDLPGVAIGAPPAGSAGSNGAGAGAGRSRAEPGPGRRRSPGGAGAGKRGAVLLLEWEDFRALLPVGLDFDTLEELQDDPTLAECHRPTAGGERLCPCQPAGVDREAASPGGPAQCGSRRPGGTAVAGDVGGSGGL